MQHLLNTSTEPFRRYRARPLIRRNKVIRSLILLLKISVSTRRAEPLSQLSEPASSTLILCDDREAVPSESVFLETGERFAVTAGARRLGRSIRPGWNESHRFQTRRKLHLCTQRNTSPFLHAGWPVWRKRSVCEIGLILWWRGKEPPFSPHWLYAAAVCLGAHNVQHVGTSVLWIIQQLRNDFPSTLKHPTAAKYLWILTEYVQKTPLNRIVFQCAPW